MLKKRMLAVFVMAAMLVSMLSGCGGSGIMIYGDEAGSDTLYICVDSAAADPANHMDQEYENKKFFTAFAAEIKSACGIEKLVFEILPQSGAARESRLQRLRTEIMAGEGPDLFIMNTVVSPPAGSGFPPKSALFKFPEKNMEAGLFLPLDAYMENHTKFTDWDAQTKAVMDAGRNEEGQQIIPLTYEFPVLVYPKSEMHLPYTTDITVKDILSNPETADLGAAMYTDKLRTDEEGVRLFRSNRLFYMIGRYADYTTDELLFTEDELYENVVAMKSVRDKVEESDLPYFEEYTKYWGLVYALFNKHAYFETEMTLAPIYSDDGGVTARITSYAAVNRNTNHPEEAFAVIDYLMREKNQSESQFYSDYFAYGIPLQNDLGSQEKPLEAHQFHQRYIMEPYFSELLSIKEQITAVNFDSELDGILGELMFDNSQNESISRETVSEAYEKMKRMMGE